MEKFFIMKGSGKQEVEGKRLTITINGLNVCQAFVTDYGPDRTGGQYVVTEMASGYQIGNGPTAKIAKKEAIAKVNGVGPEKFAKMIADAVERHGVVNK